MGFLRECARVLKPGGKIIVTTPNIMHLAARMSAFLTGQRNLRRGLINEVQTLRGRNGARIYHGHAFLLDYFRARYMIRLAGFDKLEVYFWLRLVACNVIFAIVMVWQRAASRRSREDLAALGLSPVPAS